MKAKTYDLQNFDFEDHIDRIIEYSNEVEYGKVTIMTGPNGYGKSLLRKVLKIENAGKSYKVASVSMSQRTNANNDFGALRSLMMDDSSDATSNHTCMLVNQLFKSTEKRYLVIDEPEIGLGKEILLGLIQLIQTKIEEKKVAGEFHGIMFITHSEFFIENFPHDKFINLENLTFEEWKNRKIEPIAPEDLKEWCLAMWRAIEHRISKVKNTK